ncbi:GntR family transcriptional regulator [Alsobacter sp. KACC 23698]|uniref:GntR family transcriptional regulator n=1 Tax=Alsobacter sp. KACC 23698 TaxID=3149229 RepID=A0AAU7JDD1_9HYPH
MSASSSPAAPARREAHDVADLIARDIQSGLFAAGAWLKQIDLEGRYGRNRLEIRRALDRLVQKRLVAHWPNRGYRVHEEDGERAAKIRDIRLILELAAVDGVIARAAEADVARLAALARNFDDLVLDGAVLEQYDANVAFHLELLRLNGNDELTALVTDLRGRISSAPASQWRTRRRVEQSSREHFAMVDAVAARDAERLRALIRAHILQTGFNLEPTSRAFAEASEAQ